MIRGALIGDNYLSSTLVVEKVKKVCQLQETRHTFPFDVNHNHTTRAIQALYVGSKACVKVGGLTSEDFEVCRGVRQGCTLSPWLFNLFMDNVMREARGSFVGEVQLSTGEVGVLLFADDMVVMADSKEGLQHNLKTVSDMLNKWELKINWRTTKVMRVARDREEFEVKIGDEVIEQVDTMSFCIIYPILSWLSSQPPSAHILLEHTPHQPLL